MTSAAEMLANKSKAKTLKGAHQGASDQEGDDHEDES
jgi:hypothetical protein